MIYLHFPNMSSWRGAQLRTGTKLRGGRKPKTQNFVLEIIKEAGLSNVMHV
jgi:hypothetical protein